MAQLKADMAEVDAMPPAMRAMVHEYGLQWVRSGRRAFDGDVDMMAAYFAKVRAQRQEARLAAR